MSELKDIDEHRPMVDEFFSGVKEWRIFPTKDGGIRLDCRRCSLWFSRTDKVGIYKYDGWETHVGDMGFEIQEPPHEG